MNVNYSTKAIADLEDILSFISIESPTAANMVVGRLMQAIAILGDFPLAGRPGRIEGTRELPIARLPYFAVYRIGSETELYVLAIVHTSRKWPPDDA